MRIKYVMILKLLLLFGFVTAKSNSNNINYKIVEASNQCDGYCFKMLKPILENIAETKTKLDNYENLVNSKDEQIFELQNQLAALKTNENLCNETIQQKDDLIQELEQKTCPENNVEKSAALLQVPANEDSANQTNELIIQELPTNCLIYENSTGINDVEVPNVGRLKVLCDEGGWTVVQRRFNGSENFYRNWTDYRNGFGKLQGEFFIGLEALHQMTTSEPYELYIELMHLPTHVRYARYDHFVIGSEEEEYNLKSLGSYSGNAGDALRYNLNDKFTTFDWDNDGWNGNCANYYASGGWFNLYANSNLFGKYFDSQVENMESIWWYNWKGYKSLSSVKMMIRPRDSEI
ncbi:fibrinogen-like protein 1 isoform X2 [Drosophila sulfurigaster albostrigata]|uniref:fibrinogen-like protein 1 isoform X2 n=1 Tax=Drosophila sulfurigaster albostrigata TaxID=89887 RepID=UPI002D21B6A6|nr:fibrinogen-like protein 1 isoform X2 [Drosophila sulfurigaster albostrigata]